MKDVNTAINDLDFESPKIHQLRRKRASMSHSMDLIAKNIVHNVSYFASFLPDSLRLNDSGFDNSSISTLSTSPTHGSNINRDDEKITRSPHFDYKNNRPRGGKSMKKIKRKMSDGSSSSNINWDNIDKLSVVEKLKMRDTSGGLSCRKLTCLYIKIVNFRELLGLITQDEFCTFYELLLNTFIPILHKREGIVDFSGDIITASFKHESFLLKQDCESAVLAGIEIKNELDELNITFEEMGFRKIKLVIVVVKYREVFEGFLGNKDMRRLCSLKPHKLNRCIIDFCEQHGVCNEIVFDEKVHEHIGHKFVTKLIQAVKYDNSKKKIYRIMTNTEGKLDDGNLKNILTQMNGKELQQKLDDYEKAWDCFYQKDFVNAQSALLKYFEHVGNPKNDDISHSLLRKIEKKEYRIFDLNKRC